jgi:hypothetical protein
VSDASGGMAGQGADWPLGLARLVSTQPLKGGFICSTIRGRLADGRPVPGRRDGVRDARVSGIAVAGVRWTSGVMCGGWGSQCPRQCGQDGQDNQQPNLIQAVRSGVSMSVSSSRRVGVRGSSVSPG